MIEIPLESFTEIELGLAAIVTAFGVIQIKLITPTRRAFERFNEISKVIQIMEAQFKNNGGSSMRDAIDRMGKQLTRIEGQVDRVDAFCKIAMNTLLDRPVFISDGEGRCQWASVAYTQLVKRSFEELQGRGWESVIHAEDRERVVKEWHDAIEAQRSFDSVYRLVDSTGRSFMVRCRSSGNLSVGYIGFIEAHEKDEHDRSRRH